MRTHIKKTNKKSVSLDVGDLSCNESLAYCKLMLKTLNYLKHNHV
jgi:hypothetical protein